MVHKKQYVKAHNTATASLVAALIVTCLKQAFAAPASLSLV